MVLYVKGERLFPDELRIIFVLFVLVVVVVRAKAPEANEELSMTSEEKTADESTWRQRDGENCCEK